MILGGIQRCSTIDFPGTLACVLFARGCNLNCFYCHNRALFTPGGPVISMDEARAFLKKRQGLLDGVVLSGGEPCLQAELLPFLHEIKAMGYKIKLDTNGTKKDTVRALIADGMLDYIAVDLKAPEEDYAWVTGAAAFEAAQETIRMLLLGGVPFEARCTLYPGLTAKGLLEILRAVPALPRFRLNLFRMPELIDPAHALLIRRAALTEKELVPLLPALKEAQPGVEW